MKRPFPMLSLGSARSFVSLRRSNRGSSHFVGEPFDREERPEGFACLRFSKWVSQASSMRAFHPYQIEREGPWAASLGVLFFANEISESWNHLFPLHGKGQHLRIEANRPTFACFDLFGVLGKIGESFLDGNADIDKSGELSWASG